MELQGDFDDAVNIAERVYEECWDDFQSWYSHQAVEKMHFGRAHLAVDLQEEEFDENFYKSSAKNNTIREIFTPSYSACYLDGDSLDLEDDLVEPELEQSRTWKIALKLEAIPQYSSFTPVRQLNYLRGNLWINESGDKIRLTAEPDDNKSEREKILAREVIPREAKGVLNGTINNAETDEDPANNRESMPFIPPEIPRSDINQYARLFHDHEEWQDARVHWDNDEDIIGGEAIRRLLFIYDMDEDTIDRTEVLPRSVRQIYNALRHRTYPDLNVIFPRNPPLPPLPTDDWAQFTDAESSLEDRIREQAFFICHRIDCQGVMCRTHYEARYRAQQADPVRGPGPQTPRWSEPTRTAPELIAKFRRDRRTPCGQSCFMNLEPVADPSNFSDDIVGPGDESELDLRVVGDIKTFWKVESDAMPCDVAGLGLDKFTCRQAYLVRCEMYPDLAEPEPNSEDSSEDDRRNRKGKGKGRVYNRPKEPAQEECDHAGTCVDNPACRCFNQKTHCLRNCKCDTTCKSRWTGCSCAKSSSTNICRTAKCRCFNNSLECDPELCKGCSARDGYPCMNVPLLMRNWKATRVKPSYFGNGLFLATGTNAVKDDLVSDYMGDITHERTGFQRSMVAESNGRNYLFDVPGLDASYDAGFIGNESRFANHPMNGNENCVARYVYVGGEKRIGIYATKHIYQGDELLLNYGEKFFNRGNEDLGQRHGDSDAERSEQDYEDAPDEEEEEVTDEEASDGSLSL